VLALTDNATDAIEGILSALAIPDGAGVRIASESSDAAVEPDETDLSVTVAAAPAETDQVIDEQGARVFVDQPVADYLDDKLLDARIIEEQVSFVVGEQEP
jgi:iron-sulfur cluster assembly protein